MDLSGIGASGAGLAPDITVTPLSLDFGSVAVGVTAGSQPVTVTNDGTADLDVKALAFTTTAGFQKTADGCSNTTLTPGQSCTVSVAFKPGSTGTKSSKLSIPTNDPDENPLKVDLSGVGTTGGGGGTVPDITVTPASLDFGSIAVGATSGAQPVTIQNDGTGDLLVKTITLTGAAFQKTVDGCSNTTLVPGQSCTVSVAFKPGSTGAKASMLSIPSNDPDASENPAKVALSGIGTSGGGGGTVPDITVTPVSLDFGSIAVGATSDAQPVTIQNDGTGDLLIKGITLAGTAFQKTLDGCSNTTLTPGQSCTVSVLFKPGATGMKASTLSIPSNDPDAGENPAKVALSGIATSGGGGGTVPDITVTPASLDFGSIAVGTTSGALPVTVTNDGAGDLIIRGITFTGTQFQKALDGCSNTTLPPGLSCTVSVLFKPSTTGLKTSKLSIPSNDPNPVENPARVDLTGLGQ